MALENIVIAGVSAAVAWTVALLLLRFQHAAVWFHALIVGGICAAAECVLFFTKLSHLSEPVSMVIFLLVTLAVGLEKTGSHGNALLAFLTARGAYSIFQFAAKCGGGGIWIAFILQLAFAVFAWKMRRSFPERDWRDYFSGASPSDKKLDVRTWQVYAITAAQCILCCSCSALLDLDTTAESVLVLLVLCLVYWGALLGVSLLIEYRRESMAALIEQQYRGEMQSFMNVIRSQRHDYNFHVQTLARLFQTGNTGACAKYVDELVRDSIAMNTLLPVKDPAISALINNFRTLAARDGIELHIDVQNDLSHVVTNVYETNKIISNLLQNAIDEVRNHTDKSYGIHLTILKRGEYCVIHVTNAFHSEVSSGQYISDIYRHGYTTKPGHDGVGLSSVRSLLERYKGVIYTQIENGTIRFTVKIPLQYAENQEDQMNRKDIT